jgi:predicted Rossmann fold nucleotide-binding protein DprA/Smf involved in DNA uptake
VGPGEILDCLGQAGQTLKAALQPDEGARPAGALFDGPSLSGDAANIYSHLTTEPVYVDALGHATGLAMGAIQAALMQLQLTGLVERLAGNRVRRRR